jgi:hypothetical protein
MKLESHVYEIHKDLGRPRYMNKSHLGSIPAYIRVP